MGRSVAPLVRGGTDGVCIVEIEDRVKASLGAATVRERLPPRRLKFVRLEHAHGIALLGDDVLNGR
jgi:hypothetical protein